MVSACQRWAAGNRVFPGPAVGLVAAHTTIPSGTARWPGDTLLGLHTFGVGCLGWASAIPNPSLPLTG